MRLFEWGLATFHSGFFFATILLLVYSTGALGSLLASLNTIVGVILFCLFWLTTWWCTRQAIRRITSAAPGRPVEIGKKEIRKALYLGAFWGGLNGILFLIALFGMGLVAEIISVVTTQEISNLAPVLFFGLFAVLFGPIFAFILGAFFGFLFALMDGALISVADYLARRNSLETLESSNTL
jgi:hypothetical protein